MEEFQDYDANATDQYIWDVRRKVQDIKDSNTELEGKQSKHQKKQVQDFIRINESVLLQQAQEMQQLSTELQELFVAKDQLEEHDIAYQELLASDTYTSIIEKIRKINILKKEMNTLLDQRGIEPPL